MPVERATWREISWSEPVISSAAAATVETLAEVCSAAVAEAVAWRDVSSAIAAMLWAVLSSSVAAEATVRRMSPTPPSKLPISCSTAAARTSFAARSVSATCCSRSRSIALSLNTWTALAMSPNSSERSRAGMATPLSPWASPTIAAVIA